MVTPPPPPLPPAPAAVAPAPARPVAPSVPSAATFDRLARCESSGRWDLDTGNGYYGGLQFGPATWRTYGGEAFAPYPHLASREQQIAVAQRLQAARGWRPWPSCSRQLRLA